MKLSPCVFLACASRALVAASPLEPKFWKRTTPGVSRPVNASLPTIALFATGGTIAGQAGSATQTTGYSIGGLGVDQLIANVPAVLNITNINAFQVSNVGSPDINQTILLELATLTNQQLADPRIAGVVITHGTDTMEETAFFLNLVVNSTKPLVLVGAMRPATALSADGPLNLIQAVTLAVSSKSVSRGTMVILNDRINSAYFTTKNNANALDTFHANEPGQLGFFINGNPNFYYSPTQPTGRTVFNVSGVKHLPQVDIYYGHQECNPALFNASVASGAKGIIIAGTGAGGINQAATDAAHSVFNRTGVPIITSRRPTDGFAVDAPSWSINSGWFNAQKSRILLQMALMSGYNYTEIGSLFAKSTPLDKAVMVAY